MNVTTSEASVSNAKLALFDYRRRTVEVYRNVRCAVDPSRAWRRWRADRDHLFREHSQSPLTMARRASFHEIDYYDYDPDFRTTAVIEPTPPSTYELHTSHGGSISFERFGRARFQLRGQELGLDVYWLQSYGGGVFIPLRDATSGTTTYGGGRYLLDTAKGADLGGHSDEVVFDFNFAYNPSCAHDSRWGCPLAPPGSTLPIEVTAGERNSNAPATSGEPRNGGR